MSRIINLKRLIPRGSSHRYTHTLKARHPGMDCRNPYARKGVLLIR